MKAKLVNAELRIRNDLQPVYRPGAIAAHGYRVGPRGTEYSATLELECDREFFDALVAWMKAQGAQGLVMPELPEGAVDGDHLLKESRDG
jgi:hypothetical protein